MLLGDTLLFGTRLWHMPDLDFPEVPYDEKESDEHDKRMLTREVERLKQSVEAASRIAAGCSDITKICMTHFPPVDFSGKPNDITRILADFGTEACIFGHVHGLTPGQNGILIEGCRYYLTTPDYLQFRMLRIRA